MLIIRKKKLQKTFFQFTLKIRQSFVGPGASLEHVTFLGTFLAAMENEEFGTQLNLLFFFEHRTQERT